MTTEIIAPGSWNRNRPIKVKASNWLAVGALFAVLAFVAPIVVVQWLAGVLAIVSVRIAIHYFFHEKPKIDTDPESSTPDHDPRKLY